MPTREVSDPGGNIIDLSYGDQIPEVVALGFRSWLDIDSSGSIVITTAGAGTAERAPNVTVVGEGRWSGARVLALRYMSDSPDSSVHPEGQRIVGDVTSFVYQGSYHEFETTVAGDAKLDLFESMLRRLEIVDTPVGITVSPRLLGRQANPVNTQVMVGLVPDVAAFNSYFEYSGASLPAHRGSDVGGGELWRLDDRTVLLGGRTAVTEVRMKEATTSPLFERFGETLRVEYRL